MSGPESEFENSKGREEFGVRLAPPWEPGSRREGWHGVRWPRWGVAVVEEPGR